MDSYVIISACLGDELDDINTACMKLDLHDLGVYEMYEGIGNDGDNEEHVFVIPQKHHSIELFKHLAEKYRQRYICLVLNCGTNRASLNKIGISERVGEVRESVPVNVDVVPVFADITDVIPLRTAMARLAESAVYTKAVLSDPDRMLIITPSDRLDAYEPTNHISKYVGKSMAAVEDDASKARYINFWG
jgi:hypothetical protein